MAVIRLAAEAAVIRVRFIDVPGNLSHENSSATV
jgi:hypothetical protein